MKKMLLISSTIVLFCFSCSDSLEDKAKNLVRNDMKEVLKDPSSYEEISFTKLDSAFIIYLSTKEGKELYDLSSPAGKLGTKRHELNIESISATGDRFREINDSIAALDKIISESEELYKLNSSKFKGEFNGWYLTHEYRAKNGFGALDKGKKKYYFDKEVSKITDSFTLD